MRETSLRQLGYHSLCCLSCVLVVSQCLLRNLHFTYKKRIPQRTITFMSPSVVKNYIRNPEIYVTLHGLVKFITLKMHIYSGDPKRCN